jgi:hypothetical protein
MVNDKDKTMKTQVQATIKVRNPVAQHGLKLNRCVKMKDRKKAAKRGESKHRQDFN